MEEEDKEEENLGEEEIWQAIKRIKKRKRWGRMRYPSRRRYIEGQL